MEHIRSIEELSKARKEAFDQEMIYTERYPIQIRISMGSCGIAAGATQTLDAIDQFIKQNGLTDVRIKQIGCIGLCTLEPIVQVVEFGGQPVTYGKVDPRVVRRIFREHIEKHLIVQEHLVETG